MPKGHDVVDMMVNLRSPSDIDCGPRFKLTEAEPHKVAKIRQTSLNNKHAIFCIFPRSRKGLLRLRWSPNHYHWGYKGISCTGYVWGLGLEMRGIVFRAYSKGFGTPVEIRISAKY